MGMTVYYVKGVTKNKKLFTEEMSSEKHALYVIERYNDGYDKNRNDEEVFLCWLETSYEM